MTKIEERLKELEKLDKAATPGPWTAIGYDGDICGPYNRIHEAIGCSSVEVYADRKHKVVEDDDNAILIAAYRNETPKLIQALREAVEALSEIGKPITIDNGILNRLMDNMSTATEILICIEALLTEGK